MVKLKILISNSLDGSSKPHTNFTEFLKEVTLTDNGYSTNTRMLISKIIKQF